MLEKVREAQIQAGGGKLWEHVLHDTHDALHLQGKWNTKLVYTEREVNTLMLEKVREARIQAGGKLWEHVRHDTHDALHLQGK